MISITFSGNEMDYFNNKYDWRRKMNDINIIERKMETHL